jgi:hypothetical protein
MEKLSLSPPQTTACAAGSAAFARFRDLPPELRIKIWQHAMPAARTIFVSSSSHTSQDGQKLAYQSLDDAFASTQQVDEELKELTWRSRTGVPALLHVNAEARHEALKHYTPALGGSNSSPRVFVDFERDTIFFGYDTIRPQCRRLWATTKDLNRVRHLAIVPEGAFRILQWHKAGLDALEKLSIVHDTEGLSQETKASELELVEDGTLEDLAEVAAGMVASQDEQEQEQEQEQGQGQEDPPPEPEAEPEIVNDGLKQYAAKKRVREAREELDTLMAILPTCWNKPPIIATAVLSSANTSRRCCPPSCKEILG